MPFPFCWIIGWGWKVALVHKKYYYEIIVAYILYSQYYLEKRYSIYTEKGLFFAFYSSDTIITSQTTPMKNIFTVTLLSL